MIIIQHPEKNSVTRQRVLDDEGNVAVLVSHGYGAGYSTNNLFNSDECIFDPFVVEIVSKPGWYKKPDNLKVLSHHLKDKYGQSFDTGGIEDLVVEWIPEGTKFRISEYDGAEYIEVLHEIDWIEA